MTTITDLEIISACGFSIISIRVNGFKFKSDPIHGIVDKKDIKEDLGL